MPSRCSCDVCSDQRLAAERVLEASGFYQRSKEQYGAYSPRVADPKRWLLARAQEYGAAMAVACLRRAVDR